MPFGAAAYTFLCSIQELEMPVILLSQNDANVLEMYDSAGNRCVFQP